MSDHPSTNSITTMPTRPADALLKALGAARERIEGEDYQGTCGCVRRGKCLCKAEHDEFLKMIDDALAAQSSQAPTDGLLALYRAVEAKYAHDWHGLVPHERDALDRAILKAFNAAQPSQAQQTTKLAPIVCSSLCHANDPCMITADGKCDAMAKASQAQGEARDDKKRTPPQCIHGKHAYERCIPCELMDGGGFVAQLEKQRQPPTFNEFVDLLCAAGWVSRGDAQWAGLQKLHSEWWPSLTKFDEAKP